MLNKESRFSEHDEQQITRWLAELTLAEKVSLLAGASMWTTFPIERVGIPSMKVSDGPNGVRGGGGASGTGTATGFPGGA